MLREIKMLDTHYFVDALGRKQGTFTSSHDNGRVGMVGNYVDNELRGEAVVYDYDGNLMMNRYVTSEAIYDFMLNPVSDEEKALLILKYGYPLLAIVNVE